MKRTLREGSFTGGLEKYVKQRSEMGVCFHRGPAFGEHGGELYLRPSYLEEFYEVSQRDADVLLTGISLHRDPLGEPGVDSFAGIFERKDKVYLGSFLGPRGH